MGWQRLWLVGCAWLAAASATQAGHFYYVTQANGWLHAACVLQFDNGEVAWLHFSPVEGKKAKIGRPVKGQLETRQLPAINHLIGFEVPDSKLKRIREKVAREFATGTRYELIDRDCVSLSVLACQEAGLKVKDEHFSPKSLFSYLRRHNSHEVLFTNLDWRRNRNVQLPWKKAAAR